MGIANAKAPSPSFSIEQIKERTDIRQVIGQYVSLSVAGRGTYKGICPFHSDSSPSFMVYLHDQSWHCFGCKEHGDVFDFLVQSHPMVSDVIEAKDFLEDQGHVHFTPIEKPPATDSYQGPVDIDIVRRWHESLTDFDRTWLYERLINDETIDTNLIGYNKIEKAIVVPFWRGVPGESEVDIVQFRSTSDTGRYYGLRGYNRCSLINRHLLTQKDTIIILFGTFDALLALQDGLPAVSPNGINSFRQEWVEWFDGVGDIVVVPDKDSPTELKVAEQIVEWFGGKAELYGFPDEIEGKDYTDWRVGGCAASKAISYFNQQPFG